MHFLQPLIESTQWFGENFAHNLGFIPADKVGLETRADGKIGA